jgi:hypothetical protein
VNALVVAHSLLNPEEAAEVAALLRDPVRRADEAEVSALVDRLFEGGAVAFVQEQVVAWAASVREDATLAAVPDLAAVAEELVDRVQRAARTVTATLQGNAA